MKAATALTSVLFLVLLVSVASATTGYFESGAAGINPSCTQSEPCADPFAYLSNNTFDEYLLASGEYTVDSAVVLTKPFTLRKWRERDENEPVVLTSFGSKLFYLDMQQPLTGSVTWSFQDIIMQCSNGYAIDMFDGGDGQAHLELHNVTIRNSGGGVIVWNHMLETNNLIISNISCQSGEPLAVLYSNWTFTDVTLLNNCLGGDYVSVAYVAGTEESTYFCAIPCNSSECDCNHLPLVSWNVSSELLDLTSSEGTLVFPLIIDPPAPSGFHVPLLLELSDGLLYPQHFTIQPLPSTTTASILNVTLDLTKQFACGAGHHEDACIEPTSNNRVLPRNYSLGFYI